MNSNTAAFWEAIKSGNMEVVQQHLAQNPGAVNAKNEKGFTPLILAAYYDQLPMVDFLIAQGANVHLVDAVGNNALMGASFKGYAQVVKKFIDLGVDVNVRNSQGATALIYACMFNQQAVAQLLLENGADASIRDAQGNTAKEHAQMKGLAWAEELFK